MNLFKRDLVGRRLLARAFDRHTLDIFTQVFSVSSKVRMPARSTLFPLRDHRKSPDIQRPLKGSVLGRVEVLRKDVGFEEILVMNDKASSFCVPGRDVLEIASLHVAQQHVKLLRKRQDPQLFSMVSRQIAVA